MKKSIHTITLGSAAIIACLVTTTVFVAKNNSSFINEVKADETTLTLNNDQLKQIELKDINLKGQGQADDKAFRIELGGPRYIDGAILFRDCGHQFTGNTLGDPFGIDNRDTGSTNAYNFNIVFSLERTDRLSVDMTETSLTSDKTVFTRFEIKYALAGGNDFYNDIRNDYNRFINKGGITGGIYSPYVGRQVEMDANEVSFDDFSYSGVGYRVVVLQCTYVVQDGQPYDKYYVQPGNLITFMFKKISIGYHCA